MDYQLTPIKMVVVGDNSVEKISLFISYFNKSTQNVPTVFDNYSTMVKLDGNNILLNMWDTAGAEEYNRLRPLSYPACDIFIIAFSVVQPDSFRNARYKWYKQITESVKKTPIVFVGLHTELRAQFLKSDDPSIRSNVMKTKECKKIVQQKHECVYMECSPKTNSNVETVIHESIRIGCKYKQKPIVRKKKSHCQLI